MKWNPDWSKASRLRQYIHSHTARHGIFDKALFHRTVNVDLDWEKLSEMVDELYDALDIPNLKAKNEARAKEDQRRGNLK